MTTPAEDHAAPAPPRRAALLTGLALTAGTLAAGATAGCSAPRTSRPHHLTTPPAAPSAPPATAARGASALANAVIGG
ncbi:hypothetical protein AB8A21_32055, partial [Streptomyces sp. BF23-18]